MVSAVWCGAMLRTAIISNRRITGLSADVLAELVAEIGPLWHARHQAKLASRARRRAVGAGAKHRPVFIDRLLATLMHLRHGVTHDVVACRFQVDRSTITRAIGEIPPLVAERGCTVSPGLVGADLPAPTQGALVTAHPGRAQHRPPEELALALAPPGTPRAHEPHHSSRRQLALPSADQEPDLDPADVNRIHAGRPRLTAYRARGR